jgi:hypothetical protein
LALQSFLAPDGRILVLKLAGVQLHPAYRFLMGGAFVLIGLARGGAIPIIVIGGALILWGLVALATGRRAR